MKLEYPKYHNVRYIELQKLILKRNPDSILVLGCGLGQLESILPRTIQCVGVDIDESRIERARWVNPGYNRKYLVGDIFLIDIQQMYDIIVLSELIEHVEDDVGLVRIAKSWTKRYLIITVPNYTRPLNRNHPVLGPEHVREYTYTSFIDRIVTPLDLNLIDWGGILFEIPFQERMHKLISPVQRHTFTRTLDRLFPGFCAWLYFVLEVKN